MALDKLTKIDGGGINTTSDYRVGIITARKFIGPFDGAGGNFTGVITATDGIFSGNVTIGGTLTYEDVTNIDSVGIITARDGIHVGAGLSVVGIGSFGTVKVGSGVTIEGNGQATFGTVKVGSGVTIEGNGQATFVGVTTFGNLVGGASTSIVVNRDLVLRDIWGYGNHIKFIWGTNTLNFPSASLANIAQLPNLSFGDRTNNGSTIGVGDFLMYHDYYNMHMKYRGASGNVVLSNNNTEIHISGSNGSGGVQQSIRIKSGSTEGVILHHGGNPKFETAGIGASVYGTIVATGADINGDLDVDGHTNLDNVSIAGVTTGTIFKVPNATNVSGATNHIAIGNNSDLKLYHDNNGDAQIFNSTGHLTIANNTNGKVINLQPKSGANGIIARYEGAAELYHNGNLRLATTDTGFDGSGSSFNLQTSDSGSVNLRLQNSSTGTGTNDGFLIQLDSNEDAYIWHRENQDIIFGTQDTTRWKIDNNGHFLPGTPGGYNIGSASLEIGNVYLADLKHIYFGNDQDLDMRFDGSNAAITLDTGSLSIINYANNEDVKILSDNGSGGVTNYFEANGGTGETRLYNYGNLKLTTTTTGITVTGEVAASQDYPNFRPTLDFNFAAEKKLDPRITYSRTGPASFVNEFGNIVFVGDNTPRFDHDPVTRESKGLLIEHQRTNDVANSQNVGGYSGGYMNGGTFTYPDDVVAPDGSTEGVLKMVSDTSTGYHGVQYTISGFGSNQNWAYQVWVKALPGSSINQITLYDNAQSGATNNGSLVMNTTTGVFSYNGNNAESVAYNNGWYQIKIKGTRATTNAQSAMLLVLYNGSTNQFAGDGSSGFYVWGGQYENDTHHWTSFIPTYGTIASRGADYPVILNDDFTDAISQTEGTLVAEYDNVTSDGYVISLDGSGGDKIGMVNSNGYQLMGQAGGSSQGTTDNGTLLSGTNRFALAYKLNDTGISINGNTAIVDTNYTLPTTTFMSIGHRQYQYDQLGSCIARIMYYNTRLPNSQLKTLSTR